MGDGTKIEWASAGLPRGASWNPIRARNLRTGKVGWHCTHESEGCRHCYAEGMNRRLGTGLPYKPGHEKDIEIFLDEKILMQPLKWREPRGIFVCSMTDAFADFVPDWMLDRIFAVAALATQHRLLFLTKRPKRMRDYFAARQTGDPWAEAADYVADLMGMAEHPRVLEPRDIPLPNVWLGTSCEDQTTYDARKEHLRATPAAVRFFSLEPLLGPIRGDWFGNWAIIGGESGPNARPNWTPDVRSLMRRCKRAKAAVFVKQLGGNVQDRNDAGFEGDEPHEWPNVDPFDVEHDINGFREEYQGAPVRISLRDRKGGNWDEWPEDLRVREMPAARP